jgi:hypothetical protein
MFLFSYFRFGIEGLHLALSDDGLQWRALNENHPVYASPLGVRLIRDPFVMRDTGDRFHLYATNGWSSTACFHAISDDLVHWREAELLPLMEHVPGARNVWAPECFCDGDGTYHLVWSSSTAETVDALHDWNQRAWFASSRDLANWTLATPLFDFGFSVIDPTFALQDDGWILMAFKDERGKNRGHENEASVQSKAIKIAHAPALCGPWQIDKGFISPNLCEGPTLFWRDDSELGEGWTVLFDHFGAFGFGASHSPDGKNWTDISHRLNMVGGRPHHGGVLEISLEEAARLEEFFTENRVQVEPEIAPQPSF